MPKRKGFTFVVTKSGCHICTSHALRSELGYPTTCYKSKTTSVVRYLWLMEGRELPKGMVTRHTCDNPQCINLAHIVLGTNAENNQDKVNRGRVPTGIDAGMSKLTEDQVRYIIAHPEFTGSELGNKFGVNRVTINYIRAGKTWRDVTGLKEVRRGRLFGESHGMCRITKEQAQYVLDHPELSGTELAEEYGVTATAIYRIRKGLNWKSLHQNPS